MIKKYLQENKISEILDIIFFTLMLIATFLKGITIKSVMSISIPMPLYKILCAHILIITATIGIILSILLIKDVINEKYEKCKCIIVTINIIILIYISFQAENIVLSKRYVNFSFEIGYYLSLILNILLLFKQIIRNKIICDKKYNYKEIPKID